MSAAFDIRLGLGLGVPRCMCCLESAPRLCHEHYRVELEPADETVAELQSLVVAIRHREPDAVTGELLVALVSTLDHLLGAATDVDRIRHSMALAAIATRYREELQS